MIRDVEDRDANAIADIYNHYIKNTVITFEEDLVDGTEMLRRIQEVKSKYPWIVLEQENQVIGYCYADQWKERTAYRHTVEIAIYLDPNCTQNGWGSLLYKEQLSRLSRSGFESVLGGVALPNKASVRLHEKLGFEQVAHLCRVGKKFGQWLDVGYWQKMLK